jgi:predicted Zn-dependent peptidase
MIKEQIHKSLDRTIAPKIVDAIDFDLHLKTYQNIILKNGVEVYAIDAGAEEVMMVEWVYYAGNSYEEKNIVAAATNYMLKNGTSTKNAYQINEHFEYYGSFLNRNCFNETANVTLHCLTKHIGELLPVVRELLTDSVCPETELSIYKQNMQQRLAVSLKKCDFVAGRLIDSYLFGRQNPYGKFSEFADYKALNPEDLRTFFRKYYQHGKLVMFVAGKLPGNLEQLLNANFGDLSIRETPEPENPFILATEKKYRILNDAQGVQGAIRIARPFPNRHHPDFLKVQVLNCLFGGYFGSRLMANIREDKGYTYGIHSFIQNRIKTTSWMVSTEAGRDVCEETVKEVYHEMKNLREELVDDDELLLVRNFLIGSILGDLDGPFQIIARWKNIILNDLTEEYFYNSIRTIKTVTAEELKQLAEKYFQPEDFYELVVI